MFNNIITIIGVDHRILISFKKKATEGFTSAKLIIGLEGPQLNNSVLEEFFSPKKGIIHPKGLGWLCFIFMEAKNGDAPLLCWKISAEEVSIRSMASHHGIGLQQAARKLRLEEIGKPPFTPLSSHVDGQITEEKLSPVDQWLGRDIKRLTAMEAWERYGDYWEIGEEFKKM